jgi:uncharacterized membrane protein
MSKKPDLRLRKFTSILAVTAGVAFGLLFLRMLATSNFDFWFLAWNLVLGYLPLVFAYFLVKRVKDTRLLEWQNIVLAALWIGFLPNSFYIVSDLIHLRATGDISQLYDVVMLMAFIWSGFLAGFLSLFMVHQAALKRMRRRTAHGLIGLALLLCSFAIYLGRYLRWNTWDIIFNPFGVLFDVSERFINPSEHPQAFSTTLMFFVLLSSIYWTIYHLAIVARNDDN